MPTEVVVAAATSSRARVPSVKSQRPNAELKSGNMTLVSMNGRRQGVHVKVYHTTLEHFCVLYPQKKICRPMGVLNLKNTRVEAPDDARQNAASFTVRQIGFDTPLSLTFVSESRCELDAWIRAFTNTAGCPASRHPALPIVVEDEEA